MQSIILSVAQVDFFFLNTRPTNPSNKLLKILSMQKNIYQDRILRFMATFASETKSQGQLDLIEALLQQIIELSYAKDPTARWRSCQLVHCIMSALPAEAAISDDAADLVQEAMLQRLDDAKPNVRAAAVRALARLPIPDDDGDFRDCPVTVAFLDLLASTGSTLYTSTYFGSYQG
jgi:hypothetical protein